MTRLSTALLPLIATGCDLFFPSPDDSAVDTATHAACSGEAARIGAATFATLQSALTGASSGDTVDVCPGVHAGPFEITTAGTLTLRSVSGDPSDTVLDGGGTSRVLTIDDTASVVLRGLTIANGHDEYEAGGVYAAGVPWLVIDGCVFEDNVAKYGGGGLVAYTAAGSAGSIVITNSTFQRNSAGYEAGAAILGMRWDPVAVEITDSVFLDNLAGYSGGALLVAPSFGELTVDNCRFENNTAPTEGGAVSLGSWGEVKADFIETEFLNNSATTGGALLYGGWVVGSVTLLDCVARDNIGSSGSAYSFGVSGSHKTDGVVEIIGGSVHANTGGKALCADEWFGVTVDNVDFGTGPDDNPSGDICGCGDWGVGASFRYDPGAGVYCVP